MTAGRRDAIVVGISDAHDASACVMQGNRLLSAIAEERPQRVKGMGGFPAEAVEACLRHTGLDKSDVEYVVFGSKTHTPFNLHNAYASLTIADHIRMQEEYWGPVLRGGAEKRLADVFPEYQPNGHLYYALDGIPFAHNREIDESVRHRIHQLRIGYAAAWFGISPERIRFVDHHKSHAYYAYLASPLRGTVPNLLTLTADAGGDGAYETVGVFRNGVYELLHKDRTNLLASVYQFATLILGMRPNEHEYKLMGLAAYATEYHKKGPRNVFREAMVRDGLGFVRNAGVKDLYAYFRDALKTSRFDGIAGGVQDWVEEVLCGWVGEAINRSGVRDVLFAGGLALNVKATKRLFEMDAVNSVFVPAGAGDESLPIGACMAFQAEDLELGPAFVREAPPLRNAYFGPKTSQQEIDKLLQHPIVRETYDVRPGAGPDDVADFLQRGEIVALFQGAMEFGPRALGHRSIIADPSRIESVKRINNAIKMRDFWMPFAPSILSERFEDYVVNPKGLTAPYMTLSFDSTPLARRELPAGLHRSDETLRAQEVVKDAAPDYHAILKSFEERTSIGGVLNTSLNIHGKPIVNEPVDIATEILADENVDLPVIYVDGWLLTKPSVR